MIHLFRDPYEPQQVPADDSRQNAFTGHLNIYYDAVIASIRDAESVLIFGPGEAKDELRKRLEGNHLGEGIVGVEAVDKITDRQIAVCRHYGTKWRSASSSLFGSFAAANTAGGREMVMADEEEETVMTEEEDRYR